MVLAYSVGGSSPVTTPASVRRPKKESLQALRLVRLRIGRPDSQAVPYGGSSLQKVQSPQYKPWRQVCTCLAYSQQPLRQLSEYPAVTRSLDAVCSMSSLDSWLKTSERKGNVCLAFSQCSISFFWFFLFFLWRDQHERWFSQCVVPWNPGFQILRIV